MAELAPIEATEVEGIEVIDKGTGSQAAAPSGRLGRPGVATRSIGKTLRVIVPVAAQSSSEIADQWAKAANAGADFIEWRVDGLVDPEIEALGLRLREAYKLPVVVTLRTKHEGGKFPSRDANSPYWTLLRQAAHWADGIDVEAGAPGAEEGIQQLKDLGAVVIASRHIFDETITLEAATGILQEIEALDPDVSKLAWSVRTDGEAEVLEDAQEWALQNLKMPSVVVGMGEAGLRTRVGERARQAAFAFAHVGHPTAPGQPHIHELRGLPA